MVKTKSVSKLCDRELLEKILGLVEGHKMLPVQNRAAQAHRVYDNKTLMETLRIKDKYLKKLRDNGYLGYSREGDKYWYTQEDVDKFLRRFHLDGIPAAPRGVQQIEVTFDIDANGILNVSAKDKGTGKEQKIRIEASSGLTEAEIQRMRDEAKANEEKDRQEKERIDKINAADSNIFATEKQLKEYGDKLPADKKSAIEAALGKLKEAHKNADVAAIDTAIAELNAAWQAASQDIYAQQQAQGAANANANANAGAGAAGAGAGAGAGTGAAGGSSQPEDVEFEEVK